MNYVFIKNKNISDFNNDFNHEIIDENSSFNSKTSSDKNYNKNYNKNYDKNINISYIKNVKSKMHELIDYKFIYYEKKLLIKKAIYGGQ